MGEALIYKIMVTAFVMPLILAGLLIWFIVLYQKKKYQSILQIQNQKLREQEMVLEQQMILEKERNRIASEMHDDLGSGLTTISYLSDRLGKSIGLENEQIQIQKINQQSKRLIINMSEIIWAMDTKFDTIENLMIYIRHYASEFFSGIQIEFDWIQQVIPTDIKISGGRRRNVFLILKEIFHNIAKHSKATKVSIEIFNKENILTIKITDNGSGFDQKSHANKGNGLHNIQKRMDILNVNGYYGGTPPGSVFFLPIPFNEINE